LSEERKKLCILIVEDDAMLIRAALRALGKNERIELYVADTWQNAWYLFQVRRNELDAVFLDAIVKDGTTEELLQRIRAVSYKGKIISTTNNTDYRREMGPLPEGETDDDPEHARCDEHCSKSEIIPRILAMLEDG
jgi:DNA-binding NtrC family response regulator